MILMAVKEMIVPRALFETALEVVARKDYALVVVPDAPTFIADLFAIVTFFALRQCL